MDRKSFIHWMMEIDDYLDTVEFKLSDLDFLFELSNELDYLRSKLNNNLPK